MYISESTIIHFSIREVLSELEIVQEYIVANIGTKLARAFTKHKTLKTEKLETPISLEEDEKSGEPKTFGNAFDNIKEKINLGN